jgi:hypothetical protein
VFDNVTFGTAPGPYVGTGSSLWKLIVATVTDNPGAVPVSTIDWVAIDLLPLAPHRTVYLGKTAPGFGALACEDSLATQLGDPTASACYYLVGK